MSFEKVFEQPSYISGSSSPSVDKMAEVSIGVKSFVICYWIVTASYMAPILNKTCIRKILPWTGVHHPREVLVLKPSQLKPRNILYRATMLENLSNECTPHYENMPILIY